MVKRTLLLLFLWASVLSAQVGLSPRAGSFSSADATVATGWTVGSNVVILATSTDSVGIGIALPVYKLHIYTYAPQRAFTTESSDATASGIRWRVIRDSASPAPSDELWDFEVIGNDGNGSGIQYAGFNVTIKDTTRSSASGKLTSSVRTNGSFVAYSSIDGEPSAGTANVTLGGSAGTVHLPQRLDFDAIAWLPGSNITTKYLYAFEQVLTFPSGTDTVYLKLRLSNFFTSLDSVEVFISPGNTNSDSGSYKLLWTTSVGEGEIFGTLGNSQADTLDMGVDDKAFVRFTFTGAFANLGAGDFVSFAIVRDNTISNNDANDQYFRGAYFYVR